MVITAKTQALEAMQKAITIEEQGKAKAAEAKWAQEQEKAVAVTKAEQEYEVARLEALKAKEEAKRIEAQGLAEAAAARAKVAAGLTPLERANIEKETAIGVAQALAQSNVRWVPEVMVNGGSGSNAANPMDAVGLNMLLEIAKKQAE